MGHIGTFASCGGLHERGDRVTVMEKEGQERHFDSTSTLSPPPITAVCVEPPLPWVGSSEKELVNPDVLSGLAPQGVSLEQPNHWPCEPSPLPGSACPSGSPGICGQNCEKG